MSKKVPSKSFTLCVVSALFLATTSASNAAKLIVPTIEGGMSCKVKSQKVMEIEEGIPSEFSGFNDSFEVGDTLDFEYKLDINLVGDTNTEPPLISVSLKHSGKDQVLIDTSFASSSYVGMRDDLSGFRFAHLFQDLWFDQSSIRVQSLDGRLIMSRYYKDDWDGMFVRITPDKQVVVVSVDCRQQGNYVDEVIEAILGVHDQMYSK